MQQIKIIYLDFGAYDRDPYSFSVSFDSYGSGIDFVARSLAKHYLNVKDTHIYDGELATGMYYNEPTLAGVNVRYATDPEWCEKVYRIMEYLYGKL